MTFQKKKTIILDADGVLVDYHLAYKLAWEKAFGVKLQEVNPRAYLPMHRWGVKIFKTQDERMALKRGMGSDFWASLPALPGAVEACHLLVKNGHDLICVTALDHKYQKERARNLIDLGFPIDTVHCTGSDTVNGMSPKAKIVNELGPVAFVDDHAPYLRGVGDHVHRALILGAPEGSPNVGADLALAHSTHLDLLAFAKSWCAQKA
jgi:phosphoglycolate phosphatase-like HAD superfamily hydrolase